VSALQAASLILVAIAGTSVVITPEPLRQAIVLGVYGLALTAMFFTLQAPDVALSEIVVSGLAMPLIVLAALRKIREQETRAAQAERDDEEDES
jgi:energy-converting hydrogenase B subunit D